jgi:hypothetical protein
LPTDKNVLYQIFASISLVGRKNLRLDMPTPQLFDPPDPLTMLTLPFFFWASSFIENAQAACFHYVMIAIKIYFTRLTFEYGWTQQEEDAGLFAL